MGNNIETAIFGGGCFWCTEAVFKMLRGVTNVEPGYAGGQIENPTYHQVAMGGTGHAEVIKIDFNPQEIKFRDLLAVFFGSHDPTTPNRQGADVGEEYRSIILYTNTDQKNEAEEYIRQLNASASEGSPIITEVKPLDVFYPAEEYHKDYYEKNKNASYCQIVINPKLAKAQKEFANLLKSSYSRDISK